MEELLDDKRIRMKKNPTYKTLKHYWCSLGRLNDFIDLNTQFSNKTKEGKWMENHKFIRECEWYGGGKDKNNG